VFSLKVALTEQHSGQLQIQHVYSSTATHTQNKTNKQQNKIKRCLSYPLLSPIIISLLVHTATPVPCSFCCQQEPQDSRTFERLADNAILYIAVNFAGMYTKYLTDRGQRKAFLETHRSMETRCRTQKENDRQEKLLLSGAQ